MDFVGPYQIAQLLADQNVARVSDSATLAASINAGLEKLKGEVNGTAVDNTVNLNSLTTANRYGVAVGPADYQAQNFPANTRGTVTVTKIGAETLQVFAEYRGSQRLWIRSSQAGVWLGWREVGKEEAALDATTDLNTVTAANRYGIATGAANWAALHYPADARGTVTVTKIGSETLQVFTEFRGSQRMWVRSSQAGTWLSWREIGTQWVKSAFAGDDLNALTDPGLYQQPGYPTDWRAQHYPANVRGVIEVKPVAQALVQVLTTFDPVPRTYKRWRNSGTWGAWVADALPDVPVATGSGLKVVPLQLTLGTASSGNIGRTGTVRIPIKYAAPVLRWRLHIRNANASDGVGVAGAVPFTGLWLGKHDTANPGRFQGAPVKIADAFSLPADGSEYVTRWLNLNNTPNVEDLLSFGYDAPAVPVRASSGFAYQSTDASLGGTTGPVTLTETTTAPFFIWFEAETYAMTPTAAVLGDSLSCGDIPRVGSVLSKYCLQRGALPIHYANSGDRLLSWQDPMHPKWDYYAGLSRPDALIIAMGSNDIFTGASYGVMQQRLTDVAALAASRITPNIYLSSITPRTVSTGATEDVRRSYNTWLRSQPVNARGVFDFVTPISSDDETILPQYDADGVHLTDAGYELQAARISPPITSPPLAYAP